MNHSRSKPRAKSSTTTVSATPLLELAQKDSKPDRIQVWTILLAVLALFVSIWAANEARQTRLDTRRIQLRSEAMALLQETRSSINTFNCYALVKGAELQGKEKFMEFFAEQEKLIRDGFSQIAEFSPDDLAVYEKELNQLRGKLPNRINEVLVLARNNWDQALREKADSVCKI